MLRRQAFTCVVICALLTTQTLVQPTALHAAAANSQAGLSAPLTSQGQVASNTYVNPSYDEINRLLEEVAREKDIPSIILKTIAFKESSWRQFDKAGNPLLSRPVHPGIGIMQITTYDDNDQETITRLKTDIEFNIRKGADLLNEKWGFTPRIGDGDRNKLENWYFALWAYNIWTDKNNPKTLAATSPGTLSYQEKVLRLMAQPEGFLANYIEAVEVTPIPTELLPATGVPDKKSVWATPEPFHYGDLNAQDNMGDPGDSNDPNDANDPNNPNVPKDPDEANDPNTPNNPNDQEPPRGEEPSRGGEQPGKVVEFVRLAGDNRIDTAIEQAMYGWPSGAETVFLARADHFPDALAGVPLAAQYEAPILLTSSNALDPRVETALQALGPKKVVLLGGEGALSQEISAKLTALGWGNEQQIRVSGLNRYETAANIALTAAGLPQYQTIKEELDTIPTGSTEAVAIVTGQNFPDALSIAALAGIKKMPILLTESNTLPEETLLALNVLNPQKVYLISSEGAIGSAVAAKVQEQLGLSSTQLVSLYGESRYDTMAAVVEAFMGESLNICFATGQEFPDALAGAALAARLKATVILLPKSSLEQYPKLKNAIARHPRNYQSPPYIFGGDVAVSPERVEELKTLLRF